MNASIQITGIVTAIQRGSIMPEEYGPCYRWAAEVTLPGRPPVVAEVIGNGEQQPAKEDFLMAVISKALHSTY